MTGRFIDNFIFRNKALPNPGEGFLYLDTDFGKIRVFDTKGNKPVIINVPDGPNVIEHHLPLIQHLSRDFRLICFEYPGIGFSFPNRSYNYSFEHGSSLLHQIMDLLKVEKTSLLFSCSNGFYAIQAAKKDPNRFEHIFLSQTPSISELLKWAKKAIPSIIKTPIIGQLTNFMYAKKFADIWYSYALPQHHPLRSEYSCTAKNSISKGGCFCLSSLVLGLKRDRHTVLCLQEVPTTLVWGAKDFTHRKTDTHSLRTHIQHCEIIEFEACGHFPELENSQEYARLIKERLC